MAKAGYYEQYHHPEHHKQKFKTIATFEEQDFVKLKEFLALSGITVTEKKVEEKSGNKKEEKFFLSLKSADNKELEFPLIKTKDGHMTVISPEGEHGFAGIFSATRNKDGTPVGTDGADFPAVLKTFKKGRYAVFAEAASDIITSTSNISYVDGEKGVLNYGKWLIQDLMKNNDYMEVSYGLLTGELPKKDLASGKYEKDYTKFLKAVAKNSVTGWEVSKNTEEGERVRRELADFVRDNREKGVSIDPKILKAKNSGKGFSTIEQTLIASFDGKSKDADAMTLLEGVVTAYYSKVRLPLKTKEQRDHAAVKVLAIMPTFIALVGAFKDGEDLSSFKFTRNKDAGNGKEYTADSYAENYLKMRYGNQPEKLKFFEKDPNNPNKFDAVKALHKILIVHADHSYNASTTAAVAAASTGKGMVGALLAAVDFLSGTKHGKANMDVFENLTQLTGQNISIDEITPAKSKKQTKSEEKVLPITIRQGLDKILSETVGITVTDENIASIKADNEKFKANKIASLKPDVAKEVFADLTNEKAAERFRAKTLINKIEEFAAQNKGTDILELARYTASRATASADIIEGFKQRGFSEDEAKLKANSAAKANLLVEMVAEYNKTHKGEGLRIPGIGHKIYKENDPRAGEIKEIFMDIYNKYKEAEKKEKGAGKKDFPYFTERLAEKFEAALALEDAAKNNSYFRANKTFPNVDFYSSLVFEAMGIDKDVATNIFEFGRAIGQAKHVIDAVAKGEGINRPIVLYTGPQIEDNYDRHKFANVVFTLGAHSAIKFGEMDNSLKITLNDSHISSKKAEELLKQAQENIKSLYGEDIKFKQTTRGHRSLMIENAPEALKRDLEQVVALQVANKVGRAA